MLRLYPHGNIPDNTKRQMRVEKSDGIFDESLAKGKPSLLLHVRDKDLENNQTAEAQTWSKKSSRHVLARK